MNSNSKIYLIDTNTAMGIIDYAEEQYQAEQNREATGLKLLLCDNCDRTLLPPEYNHKLTKLGTKEQVFIAVPQMVLQEIPQSFPSSDIISRVFNKEIVLEDGLVLNTLRQVKKATDLIDFECNVQIGMFMMVCIEINAVKPNVSHTDFVRALFELVGLADETETKVKKVADGFRLKVNGGRRRGKQEAGLPTKHRLWKNVKDREYADSVYRKLREK